MGSGASKQLKCPDNYDNEKFKKILILYDRLDSNGDQVVEADELRQIADLHVKNKIGRLKEFIDKAEYDAQQKYDELEKIAAFKISAINSKLILDIQTHKNRKVEDVKDAQKIIDTMQNMTKENKAKKFKEAVSDKDGHIKFWTFFDYIKDRTDDIQNIVW
jgi:superfamily I DNA/RNA helicase